MRFSTYDKDPVKSNALPGGPLFLFPHLTTAVPHFDVPQVASRTPHIHTRRSFLQQTLAGLAGSVLFPAGAWAHRGERTQALSLAHLVLRPTDSVHETAILEGGRMGAEEAAYNASLFGATLRHEAFVVASTAEVASAARSAAAAPCIIAHLPDASAVGEALDATADTGTLLFNTGALADDLRGDRCHPRLFHVTASHAQRADALVQWASNEGIRSLTLLTGRSDDAVTIYAEEALQNAGITVSGITESPQETADGAVWVTPSAPPSVYEALQDGRQVLAPHLTPAASGVAYGPVLWHANLFKYGARQVSNRFAQRAEQPMGGTAYANWLAMQIAADALAHTDGTDPDALRAHLRTTTRFDGRKAAPISFRSYNQQARHEMIILGPDAQDPITGTIPAQMPDALEAQTAALDALGSAAGACTL